MLKQLGLGRNDVEYRWSAIKERYRELYDESLEGLPGADAVMSDCMRYATPRPTLGVEPLASNQIAPVKHGPRV